jgi:NAD(P)-dependent dehydrogenase (short-subunit alcohol dehydrogenase family)
MAWTTRNIPDLNGKTAVVTGANGGLGLATTKALAGAGAHVVMAARDQEKARIAYDDVLATHPAASLQSVELDLGSLGSIEGAAATIANDHPSIDILVNNAGLMAIPEKRTADGYEMQFGVNHLGHWALTALLLPCLLAARVGRVVTVTSTAHHMGRAVDPDNPNLDGNYAPWKAYGQSKLANYHFALGLQREFDQHRLKAQSLVSHPGLTNSDLQKRTTAEGGDGAMSERLAERMGMSVERGALPQIRAATDPRAKGGEMYAPRFINSGAPVRRPIMRRIGMSKAIKDLWEVSEEMTGLTLEFDSTPAESA